MNEIGNELPTSPSPTPNVGRPFWPTSVAWLAGTLAISLALAWLASRIEPYFAPLLLFPVLIGIALGGAMVGLVRVLGQVRLSMAALGVVVGVATIVVGQHYLAYRRARNQIEQQLARFEGPSLNLAALTQIGLPRPPESLLAFLHQTAEQGRPLAGHVVRGGLVWAWWGLDAALTLVAAAVPVWMVLRRRTAPIR